MCIISNYQLSPGNGRVPYFYTKASLEKSEVEEILDTITWGFGRSVYVFKNLISLFNKIYD